VSYLIPSSDSIREAEVLEAGGPLQWQREHTWKILLTRVKYTITEHCYQLSESQEMAALTIK
jgi:hypothetical protein